MLETFRVSLLTADGVEVAAVDIAALGARRGVVLIPVRVCLRATVDAVYIVGAAGTRTAVATPMRAEALLAGVVVVVGGGR